MLVRLFLFGPPRVAQHVGWVALAFERRSQLLTCLALRHGWVPRTEIAAMLWPHASAEQAHANLRKTLFRLRTLPWAPAIAEQDQLLCFVGTSDVGDFESAIAQRNWARALEIADGPLLAGFDDDANEAWSEWLRTQRARLRSAWHAAALQCMAVASDPADALALSARMLAQDPLDESAVRAQMLAYAQQGHPARARDAYSAYSTQLADKSGGAPTAELQALHATLGAPSLAQAPRIEDATRIVGRAAERHAVRARLAQGCRLLCLIGPGGVGKSSLANLLLPELAPLYADGAVYVQLDDVSSPDALGTRLARELSVPLRGGAEPLPAVIAWLRERRMLLVLDNAEHLQLAAQQLQAVLDACPHVQMLVTSRVRLGLPAEQLLPLDGLPYPEPEDADRWDTFDATRLFVRAAQAVQPALQPSAEAAAIGDICRLVDGLPLALEIAAAWTRMLSCADIANELRRGIDLLTAADPVRPARHASMAAVFEQSWLRLNAAERSALIRLTVFSGGFAPDAARMVAGATLPVMAALADQSLLRKAGTRADLHPLLRQLAAERLTNEERDASRTAHAVYFLQMLAPLRSALQRGDAQARKQVDVEFENVRVAWCNACRLGLPQVLRSAVLPLMRYCDLRGRHPEGLALLREAAAGIGADDAHLGPLLDAAMANLELRQDRNAHAQALAERALLASRTTRDHDTRLLCLRVLGNCAHGQGRWPLARRRYRQALAQAPAALDPDNAAGMLQNLALVEKELGHYEEARRLYMQALIEHRRLRDAVCEALCLNNMAALELDTDHVDAAAMHLEASLEVSQRHALTNLQMVALTNLTDVAVRRHDAPALQQHGQRALELAVQMDARGPQSWLQLLFAQAAVQQQNLPEARHALRAAAERAIAIEHPRLQLDCVLCFAHLLLAQREPAAAIGLLRYAIDHPATRMPARNQAQRLLAESLAAHPDAASLPAAAVDLWTLIHRIVIETPTAHAMLIESLRGL